MLCAGIAIELADPLKVCFLPSVKIRRRKMIVIAFEVLRFSIARVSVVKEAKRKGIDEAYRFAHPKM